MKRLAVVITHPIQYYAPLFRLLAEQSEIQLKVFYTWSQAKEKVKDKIFGKEIQWDIPLLEGYDYEFVENISKNPGSNRWKGIDNPELISKIRSYQPVAILVFGWNMKSHFRVMQYFKGKIPVWFRGDSTLLDEKKGIKTFLRRIWLTYVYRHIDKAFYVGKESKKYFEVHGLKGKQLVYAPHAVDNQRFFDTNERHYEQEARNWRRKLGLKDSDQVVLFAGKFEDKKNPLLLIKAIQSFNYSMKTNLKLILVGTGPLEEKINSLTQNDKNIQTLPFQNQSQMPKVYRMSNLFCLPSQGPGETWGLAVNEAMASARPVLVSDKVGCSEDLVKDKPVGLIFQSGNLQDLKNLFLQLFEQNLEVLGQNAQREVRQWNFEKICETITGELKSLQDRPASKKLNQPVS